MALVVESTSFNSGNNLSSLAVNAPSGISAGDLLIHIVGSFQSPSAPPSGFTNIINYNSSGTVLRGDNNIYVSYKIAEVADESASTYSVSWGGSLPDDGGAVAMFRVSGWVSGNPLYNSQMTTSQFGSSGEPSTLSFGTSLVRPHPQLLIIISSFGSDDNTASYSASNYTVTSSDTNPSWTEVCELNYTANGNSNTASKGFTVAYATSINTSTITGFSFDISESSSDAVEVGSGLLNFVSPADVTVNTSSILLDSVMPPVAFTGDTVVFADSIVGTTETPNPTVEEGQKNWTGRSKGSGSWTPRNK